MKQFFLHKPDFFEDLIYFHEAYKNSTQFQVQSITSNDTQEIFRQAVYCFLTPATKSDSADHTYQKLFKNDFFYKASLIQITEVLREKPYIRFHNQKAQRLMLWQKEGLTHVEHIIKLDTAQEKRDYIVKNVKGMNYKEATHFLRNVGMSEDLVILDRHIIYFMQQVNLLTESQNMNILSKNYLTWEKLFVEFVHSPIWQDTLGQSTIPQADFAIWAARVREADPHITKERILTLR